MKDKLLVSVMLPATLETCEFRIPYDLTIEEGARLVARMLSAREPARYESSDDVDFMHLDGPFAGSVINPKETCRNLVLRGDLVEGSRLMLA